jgi:hypothetical protein
MVSVIHEKERTLFADYSKADYIAKENQKADDEFTYTVKEHRKGWFAVAVYDENDHYLGDL